MEWTMKKLVTVEKLDSYPPISTPLWARAALIVQLIYRDFRFHFVENEKSLGSVFSWKKIRVGRETGNAAIFFFLPNASSRQLINVCNFYLIRGRGK